jgi:2-polyprenyl-3-methyl-5-hydroxy-6-metoxy-1,4-benzoquinol methylase
VTAMPASWYDQVLPGSRSLDPLESSSALPVYQAARAMLTTDPIIDLGCGTGRFAELLHRSGFSKYRGFDFAPSVVEEARNYCTAFEFDVADVREWEHGPDLPDVCCYVLLEVLEHLDDDTDILERIPPGCPVVFSVPNFWSASHVRRYAQPGDVFARYGAILDFSAWQSVAFPTPGRRVHVFRAERRADCL